MKRLATTAMTLSVFVLFLGLLSVCGAQEKVGSSQDGTVARLPTLFLIGDSTVKNGRGDGAGALWGWGDLLAPHFDKVKVKVANRALGGRSSRTFFTEGLWEKVLADLKPGDFVMMQFGHNDGGELFKGTRPRASLKGNGDETQEGVVEQTGKLETVHSFGWYLRKFIADTKAKGATPIVCSLIPRNDWTDGKVRRANTSYGKWAKEAAEAGGAHFIDLNEIIARHYERIGQEKVKEFFPQEHTHTGLAGAKLNAECVIEGLKMLKDCKLNNYLATLPAQ